MNDKILSFKDAAKMMEISPYMLRNLLRAGKIPGTKGGGRWSLKESDVNKYIVRQKINEIKDDTEKELIELRKTSLDNARKMIDKRLNK